MHINIKFFYLIYKNTYYIIIFVKKQVKILFEICKIM